MSPVRGHGAIATKPDSLWPGRFRGLFLGQLGLGMGRRIAWLRLTDKGAAAAAGRSQAKRIAGSIVYGNSGSFLSPLRLEFSPAPSDIYMP